MIMQPRPLGGECWMDALLGVSPLLRRLCGQLGNVEVADLHHRSLNAAAAKARIGWSFWAVSASLHIKVRSRSP
jgi:hypothetical protein